LPWLRTSMKVRASPEAFGTRLPTQHGSGSGELLMQDESDASSNRVASILRMYLEARSPFLSATAVRRRGLITGIADVLRLPIFGPNARELISPI
jgi:hypothetical protein